MVPGITRMPHQCPQPAAMIPIIVPRSAQPLDALNLTVIPVVPLSVQSLPVQNLIDVLLASVPLPDTPLPDVLTSAVPRVRPSVDVEDAIVT